MFVKICGTTNMRDAELAVALGANALGFIFAPSRRQVGVAQVGAIVSRLPSQVERVGVFTGGANSHEIGRTVREAGLTAVQLHRPQDSTLLAELHDEVGPAVKFWQVVPFEVKAAENAAGSEQRFLEQLVSALTEPRISAILVDTAKGGASGGLGESFPWEKAAPVIRRARERAQSAGRGSGQGGKPLLIAGGLTAENVQEAIRALGPFGVDCVSGVEAEPGRKDRDRLASFMTAARLERSFLP